MYDISPPELKIELPKSESFVNNLEVSYDVNEPLLIAQMIWIDDKGEKTSFDLKISDLKAGKHVLKDYDIKTKEGIPYNIIIDATDRANNDASSDTVRNVMFDVTAPILTIQSPIANQAINNDSISFEISEPIKSGTVTWQAIEGNDPNSPHIRPILGDELKGGSFVGFTFISTPELINGVLYNILIQGIDLAGNQSDIMVVDNVLFDTVAPRFVDLKPLENEYIRVPEISYTLTENLSTGKIFFDYVGGANDPKKTHSITLAGSKKEMGTRGGKLPSSFIDLVNEAVYNIRFEGVDPAGNLAPETLIKNITFDNEPPLITIEEPLGRSFFNNPKLTYSLSEELVSGNIVINREGGNEDPNSPHNITLTTELMRRIEKQVMLDVLDRHWKENLVNMDHLRQGIGLRSFAAKNPKQEYKREAFDLFLQMLENIKRDVIVFLHRVSIRTEEDIELAENRENKQKVNYRHPSVSSSLSNNPQEEGSSDKPYVRDKPKIGRNEPCPCGSGKKYKQCHGRLT